MTGQRAARRKNSPRQWGRPFGRAPREICPAISTHPHWGGDCTTTLRWQDVGAAARWSNGNAFVSGAKGLRFQSRAGAIGHIVATFDILKFKSGEKINHSQDSFIVLVQYRGPDFFKNYARQ